MVSESEIFGGESWGEGPNSPRDQVVIPSGSATVVTSRYSAGATFWKVMQIVLMGAGALFMLLILGFFLIGLVAAIAAPSVGAGGRYDRKILRAGPYDQTIAVVRLSGIIGASPYGSRPGSEFVQLLKNVADASNVKGLIVEINSPGGSATQSDIIYNALRNIQKPKVALLGNIAASGGYYAAVGCDYIMAHPTTVTGSIGVVMETIHIKGLMEKIGMEATVIKSGAHKDLLSPFRSPSEEEKAILQETVDDIYRRFVSVVAQGRHMQESEVIPLADGRVFTATAALEARLIDAVGYSEDAQQKAMELAGLPDARIIRVTPARTFMDYFGLSSIVRDPAADFREMLYPRGAQFICTPGVR